MITNDAARDARKQAYLQKREAQFAAWDADVRKLRARARLAEAEARIDFYKQMEALDARLEATRRTLQELRHGGAAARTDLEAGLGRAFVELSRALSRAWSRFG